MKKIFLVFLLTGCTTLSETQIQASQLNQVVSGVAGPNNQVSAGLLQFQNYNRGIRTAIYEPWNNFFILRNLWLP